MVFTSIARERRKMLIVHLTDIWFSECFDTFLVAKNFGTDHSSATKKLWGKKTIAEKSHRWKERKNENSTNLSKSWETIKMTNYLHCSLPAHYKNRTFNRKDFSSAKKLLISSVKNTKTENTTAKSKFKTIQNIEGRNIFFTDVQKRCNDRIKLGSRTWQQGLKMRGTKAFGRKTKALSGDFKNQLETSKVLKSSLSNSDQW